MLIIDGAPSVIAYRDGAFFLRLALEGSAVAGKKLSPIEARVVSEAEAAHAAPRGLSLRHPRRRAARRGAAGRAAEGLRQGRRRAADLLRREGGRGGVQRRRSGRRTCAGGRRASPGAARPGDDRLGEGASFLPGSSAPTRATRSSATSAPRPTWAPRASASFLSTEVPKDGGAAVIVEMNGGPLLLERKFGAGAVVLCTSSCTPAWNNLPLKPYFVPVLHQIVYYLSRTGGDAEVEHAGRDAVPAEAAEHAPRRSTVEFSLPAAKDAKEKGPDSTARGEERADGRREPRGAPRHRPARHLQRGIQHHRDRAAAALRGQHAVRGKRPGAAAARKGARLPRPRERRPRPRRRGASRPPSGPSGTACRSGTTCCWRRSGWRCASASWGTWCSSDEEGRLLRSAKVISHHEGHEDHEDRPTKLTLLTEASWPSCPSW